MTPSILQPTHDALWMLLAVLSPLAGAVAIGLRPRRAEFWSFVAAALTLLGAAMLLPGVRAGGEAAITVLQFAPGLGLTLRADALGLTFALLAAVLWVISTLFSTGYVRDNDLKNRPRYYACFAASIGAATGVALAGNVLTFLLFYEALTLATYPLVLHKETPEAVRAARKYLVFALSGGVLLTVAAAWTWALTGTLEFSAGGFVQGAAGPGVLGILFLCYIIGTGIKAAIMPFHSWLPSAMVAPSPVSALLHAVAVVKAGVFGCMRVLGFVFGPESLAGVPWARILLAFCAATIVIGSLRALRQQNLKRRLAYSTIVHLSYIVFGAALLTPNGFAGSMLHMVNHGLAKITLFFCAGAIYATAHYTEIGQLKGLAKRMPWTCAAFTIGSLSLIGVPGFSGFVGKLLLARGAMDVGDVLYAFVLIGASLFTAAYLFPILRAFYFEEPDSSRHADPTADAASLPHGEAGEARLALRIPLVTTAVLVVLFGIVPAVINTQYGLAAMVTTRVFGTIPSGAPGESR
jgi:multicomponent Na+:H+ antiporter subunit D